MATSEEHPKCMFWNNQPCQPRTTHYHSLSCNTIDDPLARTCVSNKIEDVNLKVYDMIKGINESKTLWKHISFECKCAFDDRKCNSGQKWNNNTCQWERKN